MSDVLPPIGFWSYARDDGAVASGADAFGTWADFAMPGSARQPVVQRMRLIPAGTFRMGSPNDEPGHSSSEGPIHDVMIAKPFWLAETPSTQAVMGDNPSHFKGPARPVEQVNFKDTSGFLGKLNGLTTGTSWFLPSEAHWEYACRAGTTGPTYAKPGQPVRLPRLSLRPRHISYPNISRQTSDNRPASAR